MRLNNFIQPVGQLPGDGLTHDFAFAFHQIGGGGLGHGHGRETFSVWSRPDHVRGQFTVTANSWSRSGRVGVHDSGHGVANACPFCGHFGDTESFTDEGVGRALG